MTPTKTPREIILESLYSYFVITDTNWKWVDWFMEDISALLEEARQQWREEMKKEFIKFVKEETSFPKIRLLDRKDLLNFLSL